MALTITGRLLCAARHAYMIHTSGTTPPSDPQPAPPPSTLVGYLQDPACFAGGGDLIDAALFGETDTEFILAFRGTISPESPDHEQAIRDWANNLDAVPAAKPGMPGLVHPGFYDSLDDIWTPISDAIKAARTGAKADKPLYITGHSKGGAVAPLAAMRCVAEGLVAAPYVCTFAAPKCGDQNFATTYDAQVPHSVRYEYQDDIVPHLPPSDAFAELFQKVPSIAGVVGRMNRDYVAVGTLQFINWQNQVVGYSNPLYVERLWRLTQLMFTFGFKTIVNDHDCDPGSGYATAACPGVWPPKSYA